LNVHRAVANVFVVALCSSGALAQARSSQTVAGTVLDSITAAPIAGARVQLPGAASPIVTDARGRFTLVRPLPTDPVIEIRTAALDSLRVIHRVSIAIADSTRTLEIRVPTAAQIASNFCGDASGGRLGIVYGRVDVSGENTPPRGVRVVAEWNGSVLDTRANAQGIFRLCGVPFDTPVAVRAELAGTNAAPFPVRVAGDSRLVRVDLTLDRATERGATLGGVVRDSTKRGVEGATVALPHLAKVASTNASGIFQLAEIPSGTHDVNVRRIGFAPLDTQVALTSDQTVDLTFTLRRVITLDSVVTTAVRGVMSEFEEHRRVGLGHFLTREDLAKAEGRTTAALLSQIPGLRIVRGRAGVSWLASGRGPRSIRDTNIRQPNAADASLGARPDCYANVYLDNLFVYRGLPNETLFDINSLSPDRIEGIEVYASPAQTPLKYSTLNSTCGVVVIWTRRSQ
jgi:hypothetical protein